MPWGTDSTDTITLSTQCSGYEISQSVLSDECGYLSPNSC